MKLSSNAISYTLSHLFKVAFPDTETNITIYDSDICVKIHDIGFHFWIMDEEKNEQLLQGTLPLQKVNSPLKHTIPVCQKENTSALYTINEQTIDIHCDLVTLPFFLLSRYEETYHKDLDKHQRFPYHNSLTFLYQFIDYPIIDEYALTLREWTCRHFPNLQPKANKGKLLLTHDIDILFRFGNWAKNLRTIIGGDLIARHSFSMMVKSCKQLKRCWQNRFLDPYIIAIANLMQLLPEDGDEIFFFKALCDGEKDCTYDINSKEVRYLLQTIIGNKKQVGLHGSYDSYNQTDLFQREKERIDRCSAQPIKLHRQHFLRFNAIVTPKIWEEAGITDDYTLGYAEQEGFRCGTCHPFPLYDLTNDQPLKVMEHPLIAMDTTFIIHRRQNITATYQKLCQLLQTCLDAEGECTLLWHSTSTEREFSSWYNRVYRPFIIHYQKIILND